MYFKSYAANNFYSRFIDSYFSVDMNLVEDKVCDLIVPDGTFGILFIENVGDIQRSLSTKSDQLPLKKSCLFGQKTKAINYSYLKGNTKAFGFKIKPAGIPLFTKGSHELKDLFTDLDIIENHKLLNLEYEILESDSVTQKIWLIENYIYEVLRSESINLDELKLFESIIDYIFENRGDIKFSELTSYFNLNYKKIERLFNKYLGITPKMYIRIVRFNSCINTYKLFNNINLTQLGLENGYFDQSHFIKEFKQFTSLTPKKFFERDRSFSENAFLDLIDGRLKIASSF